MLSPHEAVRPAWSGREKSQAMRRLLLCTGVLALALVVYTYSGDGGEKAGSTSEIDYNVVPFFAVSKPKHSDYSTYVNQVFVDGGAPAAILQRHHYAVKLIPLPVHFNDQALRVALWDNYDTPAAVLTGAVGLGGMGRKDFLAWVSSGKNVVFLGGYTSLSTMNELFGFELEYVPYVPGPWWKNDRNTPGTPFQYGPSRLEEGSGNAVYGVKIESIPLTGYSMYDTFRVSAVFYIKYNLGTVCYVGADFRSMSASNPWGGVLRDAVRM